jgi:hypothetical protein
MKYVLQVGIHELLFDDFTDAVNALRLLNSAIVVNKQYSLGGKRYFDDGSSLTLAVEIIGDGQYAKTPHSIFNRGIIVDSCKEEDF